MMGEILSDVGRMMGEILSELATMTGEIYYITVNFIASATRPCRQFLWFALYLYISAWTTGIAWAFGVLHIPVRMFIVPIWMFTSPLRVHQLTMQLSKLQADCDHLHIKNYELETRHRLVVNEHRQVEQSLQDALACEIKKGGQKSKIIKLKMKELEAQNVKIEELQRRVQVQRGVREILHAPQRDVNNDTRTKLLFANPAQEIVQQDESEALVLKPASQGDHAFPSMICLRAEGAGCVVPENKWRGMALSSSLFSASLSIMVAVIVWKSEDPCMPLVIALFIVLGVSIAKVVQFFSKSYSRLGLDAVALVSFNSFLLGTLSYPAFPHVAKSLSPTISVLLDWLLRWFVVNGGGPDRVCTSKSTLSDLVEFGQPS